MADRSDYLRQLQEQLNAWAQWARQLEEKALASAAQMRSDAQANYEHRAKQVSELVAQGKVEMERVGASTEEAWRDIGASAEQTWSTLQAAAAALAQQVQEKLSEPAPRKPQVRKKATTGKPVAKKPVAKKKPALKARVKAVAAKGKKKASSVKARVSAARKSVVRKAKALAARVKGRGKVVRKKVAVKAKGARRAVKKVARKKK